MYKLCLFLLENEVQVTEMSCFKINAFVTL
jgi:hypothetical protein